MILWRLGFALSGHANMATQENYPRISDFQNLGVWETEPDGMGVHDVVLEDATLVRYRGKSSAAMEKVRHHKRGDLGYIPWPRSGHIGRRSKCSRLLGTSSLPKDDHLVRVVSR